MKIRTNAVNLGLAVLDEPAEATVDPGSPIMHAISNSATIRAAQWERRTNDIRSGQKEGIRQDT